MPQVKEEISSNAEFFQAYSVNKTNGEGVTAS